MAGLQAVRTSTAALAQAGTQMRLPLGRTMVTTAAAAAGALPHKPGRELYVIQVMSEICRCYACHVREDRVPIGSAMQTSLPY